MTGVLPVPSTNELNVSLAIAKQVANTEFVPDALRGRPEAVLAAILTARELQVGPMQALAKIHIIKGKPTVAPELMMALVLRAGHTIHVLETTDEKCVVLGIRAGTPIATSADQKYHTEITWTMDDAKRAGLLKGDSSWSRYPRAMLRSRAVSELCRAVFPDVLAGFSYTPEEFGAEVDEEGLPVEKEAPRIPPYAVNKETGELETVEALNEVPYVHEKQASIDEPPVYAPGPDDKPPNAAEVAERVKAIGIDEPPYAAGPDDRPPNASQLAERVKAIGVDWLQLLQDVKRNADDENIDVPPRTGEIDKYVPFRSLLQRHVEELEKAKAGATT